VVPYSATKRADIPYHAKSEFTNGSVWLILVTDLGALTNQNSKTKRIVIVFIETYGGVCGKFVVYTWVFNYTLGETR